MRGSCTVTVFRVKKFTRSLLYTVGRMECSVLIYVKLFREIPEKVSNNHVQPPGV